MDTCPNCHRKLISHTSPKCNWCGHEINDPTYQAAANVNREAFFVEQAVHDAESLLMARQTAPYVSDYYGVAGIVNVFGRRQLAADHRAAAEAAYHAAIARAAVRHVGSAPTSDTQGRTSDAEPQTSANQQDEADVDDQQRFRRLEL